MVAVFTVRAICRRALSSICLICANSCSSPFPCDANDVLFSVCSVKIIGFVPKTHCLLYGQIWRFLFEAGCAPRQPAMPSIFQKIATRVGGRNRAAEGRFGARDGTPRRKHPMDFDFHGMFRPIHGMFLTHRGLGFVTYSGENEAPSAPGGGASELRASLSGGYVFRPFAPLRAPR